VERGRAYSYPLPGYWRDVGTIEAYWQSHMDLLEQEPPLKLDDSSWPILTFGVQRLPARIDRQARIENSLIAPGCRIRGQVINSVLAPGVVVEEGAVVRNSIVFNDTSIEAGAQIAYSIVDSGVSIGAQAQVGQDEQQSGSAQPHITLVGKRVHVAQGAQIAAGSRVQRSAGNAAGIEQAVESGG
jgi:glucose-1-phosphate adenylyltransferase